MGYDRVSFGTQVERKGRRKTQTRGVEVTWTWT
jgi:hypothetical protein